MVLMIIKVYFAQTLGEFTNTDIKFLFSDLTLKYLDQQNITNSLPKENKFKY